MSGTLTVTAATSLNDQLTVGGKTSLNDSLNINNQSPTHFSGDITVAAQGTSTFNGPAVFNSPTEFVELSVNGPSFLKGQVTVRANVDSIGTDSAYQAYPLLIEGSKQGIAVKVTGSRSTSNNYISFWDVGVDGNPTMWGRIEGQTKPELWKDPEYLWEHGFKITDIVISGVDFAIAGFEVAQAIVEVGASASSSTACVGFGACVTAPIPAFIIASGTNLVLKIANAVAAGANLGKSIADEVTFNVFLASNIGVSYQSGAGDYAEWLPKNNPGESFNPGDIVGITNGIVTKSTSGAEKVMVVSTRPIVLGNIPQEQEESNYVKIAFMGQVPVRVIGEVSPGDYIIPDVIGSGFGRAVHPENMEIKDYRKIAGVAWSVIANIADGVSLVNTAVGINTNDLTNVVYQQEQKLMELQAEQIQLIMQMEESNTALNRLVPGYAEAVDLYSSSSVRVDNNAENNTYKYGAQNIVQSTEDDIVFFEVTREQIEASLEMAKEMYQQMLDDTDKVNKLILGKKSEPIARSGGPTLIPIQDHPFWQRIEEDPLYKEEVIEFIQEGLEKSMHSHKKYTSKFINLKVKE